MPVVLEDEATVLDEDEYKASFDRAFHRLVKSGREFSADDIRSMVGVPPRPNMIGAMWNGAIRRYGNSVSVVGIKPSSNRRSNGSIIMVYKGKIK